MALISHLEDFVTGHRPHGTLTATTGEITDTGYRLEIASPLPRDVRAPQEAAEDLAILARLN